MITKYKLLQIFIEVIKIDQQLYPYTSYAADGAPVMIGKKNGCLKLITDENPEMFLVHCGKNVLIFEVLFALESSLH